MQPPGVIDLLQEAGEKGGQEPFSLVERSGRIRRGKGRRRKEGHVEKGYLTPFLPRINNYYDLAGSPGVGLSLDRFDLWQGYDTDQCDDPVFAESNANCEAEPPLGPPVSITPPYMGGSSGVWSEAAPPFGGGGGGLPCDFGGCGSGFGPGAAVGVITLSGVVFQVTSWASALTAGLAGGILLAGAVALPYDVYQGYHLAQAYGYLLPKAMPTTVFSKGGKQNVAHDYVRNMAIAKGGDYCSALRDIMNEARATGDSKLFNDAKATWKQDCRGM